MSPTAVAGHVFVQSHIPYESAPTGCGRGQTDVPSYCPCHHRFCGVFAKYGRQLSLLKFMRYISATTTNFLRALHSLSSDNEQTQISPNSLLRYCCYDKRKRQNFSETWDGLA